MGSSKNEDEIPLNAIQNTGEYPLLLLDAEAALNAVEEEGENPCSDISHNAEISSKEYSHDDIHTWAEVSSLTKEDNVRISEKRPKFIKPIILVNDKPAEDLDEKWTHVLETLFNNEDKLKRYQKRRKFKRRFCRSRRYAAFKRSYSIG